MNYTFKDTQSSTEIPSLICQSSPTKVTVLMDNPIQNKRELSQEIQLNYKDGWDSSEEEESLNTNVEVVGLRQSF